MQIHVNRYRFFGRRDLVDAVRSTAPAAARVVHEHFGRRPLAPIQITLTKSRHLAALARAVQAEAAGIPESHRSTAKLPQLHRPDRLYGITVIAPKGGTLMLLNARRVRRLRHLQLTLLHEFVVVDQLHRKGAREREIRYLRADFGTQPLNRSQEQARKRQLQAEAAEAAHLERALADRL